MASPSRARRIAAVFSAATAAVLATALPAAASTTTPTVSYTFRKLDNSRDLTFNQLLGINKHGKIAGYFGSGASGHQNKGYLLKPPYTQSDYVAENYPNSAQTQVTGLNDLGVTVGYYTSATGDTGADYGFYRLSGRYHTVVFPRNNSNPPVNRLLGVNDSGVAVGFYQDASFNYHGYLYNIYTKKFTSVSVARSASVVSTGINNNGNVTGYFSPATGPIKAFLRTHTGHLYIFAVHGVVETQAFGVNDHNEVVGVTTALTGATYGFTWTPGGGFQRVSDPQGVGSTWINGVNDAGDLVGFYTSGNGNTNGMLAVP